MKFPASILRDGEPDTGGGGAAAPAAPAPAPAPATDAPAAPAADAPAPDSLLAKPDAAPAPASTDPWAAVPAKYIVKAEDGAVDQAATLAKLNAGYGALAKRMGVGDTYVPPPETPDGYTYTPPEQFKDIPLDDVMTNGFKADAHKAGLNQAQYEFVMGKYFDLVPQVLNSVAQKTAAEAKAELEKVWTTPTEFSDGIKAADRAISQAPEDVRAQVWERFGRDPLFIRFAASFGAEAREDSSPGGGAASGADTVNSLIASEAYRNPRHPDHAKVSEQVRRHFEKNAGTVPVL